MKKLSAILILAALCCGCSEDTAGEQQRELPVGEIALSTNEVSDVEFSGGTAEVSVVSNGTWRLAGEKSWCRPSAVSGESGDKVVFSVDPNPSSECRTQEYKFFCGDKTVLFTLTQAANEHFSFLTPTEYEELPDNGADIRVLVAANVRYEVRIEGGEWIGMKDKPDEHGEIDHYTFSVGANDSYGPRAGRVVFSAGGADYPVTVSQKQNDAVMLLSPERYDFETSDPQLFEVEIQTNVELTVTCDEWITWLEEEAPATRALHTRILKFSVGKADKTREGEITISNAANHRMNVTVGVRQVNDRATTVDIPDEHFRKILVDNGYVVVVDGTQVELLPAAFEVTSLKKPGSYRPIASLEGIEYFTNLEYIEFDNNNISEIDISALKNVSTLILSNQPIERIILGDNPVRKMDNFKGLAFSGAYPMPQAKNLTVSGTQLETLDLTDQSSWPKDVLESLDVSECPALTTLKCNRSYMKTLYLKAGQEIPNLDIHANTTIEYR